MCRFSRVAAVASCWPATTALSSPASVRAVPKWIVLGLCRVPASKVAAFEQFDAEMEKVDVRIRCHGDETIAARVVERARLAHLTSGHPWSLAGESPTLLSKHPYEVDINFQHHHLPHTT